MRVRVIKEQIFQLYAVVHCQFKRNLGSCYGEGCHKPYNHARKRGMYRAMM